MLVFTVNNPITTASVASDSISAFCGRMGIKPYLLIGKDRLELCYKRTQSNFSEIIEGEIDFVGGNPTIASNEAKFFIKDFTSYEEQYTINGETITVSCTDIDWYLADWDQCDYFSMVLDYGEWSFFPAWEELRLQDVEDRYEEYSL